MKRLSLNTVTGGALIAVLLVTAASGALWTPYDPLAISFRAKLGAPNLAHWLGTDEFGRDVLSRIMAGAATSVWISLLTVTVAVVLGTAIGVFSGYVRGWVDRIVMAFNDALLAFPGILLALGLLAVVGANKYGIIVALGLAYAPSVARIMRGTVLSLREQEFIASSRVIGNSEGYTMLRHVLPNCLAPLTVLATRCSAGRCWLKARCPSSALGCRRRRRPGATCWPAAGPISARLSGSASSRACASR